MKRARKAWNGGSREAAMALADKRTDEAIASGCERCPTCAGRGFVVRPEICRQCGGCGFLIPAGGMPVPGARSQP